MFSLTLAFVRLSLIWGMPSHNSDVIEELIIALFALNLNKHK